MKKNIFAICLMVVLISFPACKKEGTSPQQEGQTASGSLGSSPQKSTGNLMVKILPESPTVMTDLQVVNDGAGKITYQWQRNGQAITGENSARLVKNQFVKGDTISVTVMSDGLEGTASIVIGNSLPKVVSVQPSPKTIQTRVDLVVKPIGFDADGDEMGFHYKWSVNGKDLTEDSPILGKNQFKRGDRIILTVIPYDKDGEGEPFVSDTMNVPKAPPRIISNPPQNLQSLVLGSVYTYQVVAEADGDPLIFSLASAPPGMTINSSTGLITWQLNEQSTGTHAIEIVAQDSEGMKGAQKYTLAITLSEGGAK